MVKIQMLQNSLEWNEIMRWGGGFEGIKYQKRELIVHIQINALIVFGKCQNCWPF